MMLWQKTAEDLAVRCCTCTTMDVKTVRVRLEHEGLSFLTITLTNFGSDLQKGLDQGFVDRRLFRGFSWRGELPRFLGGFLDRVFDRSSGILLDTPCVDSVFAIRQLTLMFGKLQVPCSDTRVQKAIRGYVECEKEVKEYDLLRTPADLADFRRISSLLFRGLFTDVDREIYAGNHVPKHGPGSTADALRGNAKYHQSSWPSRLEYYFPSGEFLLPSPSYYSDLDDIRLLEPGAEMPVKVITVPKTLKTPRIIAMEPAAMQYAQQSVLEQLLLALGKDDFLSSVVGFDDQIPNQEMARIGSSDGSLATLDLSDASDRVSNQLVRAMLLDHPHLLGAVDACRSRKADVPGFGVLRLAKYASMGSALCFPFEAFAFTAMCFLGIERALKKPLRRRDVVSFAGLVRIYGDDILVPTDYVHSVVQTLTTFGSKVNLSKSFWTGRFRESCGKDYFMGEDVSIVRVRQVLPTQRKHATEIISTVALRNQMYFIGLWGVTRWLDEELKGLLRHYPDVLPSSRVLGRHTFLGYEAERVGKLLHDPLVKGYVPFSRIPSDPLDGPGALLKFFLKRGDLPVADREHLKRAGRPKSVDIKLGWFSAV